MTKFHLETHKEAHKRTRRILILKDTHQKEEEIGNVTTFSKLSTLDKIVLKSRHQERGRVLRSLYVKNLYTCSQDILHSFSIYFVWFQECDSESKVALSG